jgi:two-component system chemotaxis sensor kinase CheA
MKQDGLDIEVPRFLNVGAGEERFDPELFEEFLGQTADLIQDAERLVMKLEAGNGTAEEVRALFRVMHTIKGDSASLALSEFVHLVHAAEGYLQIFSGAVKPVSAISTSTLLQVVDALATMTDNLRERSKFLQGRTEAPRYLPVGLKPLIRKLIEMTGE